MNSAQKGKFIEEWERMIEKTYYYCAVQHDSH